MRCSLKLFAWFCFEFMFFCNILLFLEKKAPVYKHLLPVKYVHFILLVCIVKVRINTVVSNPQMVIYSARKHRQNKNVKAYGIYNTPLQPPENFSRLVKCLCRYFLINFEKSNRIHVIDLSDHSASAFCTYLKLYNS